MPHPLFFGKVGALEDPRTSWFLYYILMIRLWLSVHPSVCPSWMVTRNNMTLRYKKPYIIPLVMERKKLQGDFREWQPWHSAGTNSNFLDGPYKIGDNGYLCVVGYIQIAKQFDSREDHPVGVIIRGVARVWQSVAFITPTRTTVSKNSFEFMN